MPSDKAYSPIVCSTRKRGPGTDCPSVSPYGISGAQESTVRLQKVFSPRDYGSNARLLTERSAHTARVE